MEPVVATASAFEALAALLCITLLRSGTSRSEGLFAQLGLRIGVECRIVVLIWAVIQNPRSAFGRLLNLRHLNVIGVMLVLAPRSS